MITRKSIFIVLYILAIAAFLFGALEAVLRMGYFAPTFDQPGNRFGLKIMLDRRVLYRIEPHSRMDINNVGYRDGDFIVQRSGGRRVLFLGDSYVIGLNVKSRYTMPRLLGGMLGEGFEVLNMGVHGYGPDQSLIRLRDEGLSYKPDMVVLALYPANDYNDLRKNMLMRVDGVGGLRERSPNAVTAMLPALDSFYMLEYLLFKYDVIDVDYAGLFVTLFDDRYDQGLALEPGSGESRNKAALMEAVLGEFKGILDERGIEFLVLIIPSFEDIERASRRGEGRGARFVPEGITEDICKRLQIDCLSLVGPMLDTERPASLYDRTDYHLGVRGNRIAARTVRRHMADAGLFGVKRLKK